MDSLFHLCARHIFTQHPLSNLSPDHYPVLFKAAFLDGRPLVLRHLVATWPEPVLKVQRIVGQRRLLQYQSWQNCIKAVIQVVVEQLRRELEEPGSDSRCQLRMLDMTGILDDADNLLTEALATACVEMFKHQQELQRHWSKRHRGPSGAATATAALQPPCVDVHTDLFVSSSSYGILCDALQTRAAGPLRLRFHEFQARDLSASQIVTLLVSLDPFCLRRVDLNLKYLVDLLMILPYLLRFPELRSLKLRYSNLNVQHSTSESAIRIRGVARQLGMLRSLRELNLRSTQLSGNLRQILCDLQAPLESLELPSCSLIPADLAFVSQSFHAPVLKKLDLSGLNVSQDLLEPLQLLLEKASASLLHLDILDCKLADSHLSVLLPTLLRCSRLRVLGLHGNRLSKAVIKDLLQKTLDLPELHLIVYPYPLDCYTQDPSTSDSDFFAGSLDWTLLSKAEAEISQLLKNSGRTNRVWTHNPWSLRDLDYFSL